MQVKKLSKVTAFSETQSKPSWTFYALLYSFLSLFYSSYCLLLNKLLIYSSCFGYCFVLLSQFIAKLLPWYTLNKHYWNHTLHFAGHLCIFSFCRNVRDWHNCSVLIFLLDKHQENIFQHSFDLFWVLECMLSYHLRRLLFQQSFKSKFKVESIGGELLFQ